MRQVRVAPRRHGARSKGIPALDGVRAIAVGLVLAEHGGIPGVSGGFLGVDVFFVLSGFLITSLLLDELRGSGRIALAGFWIRRARRLLPALIVMVLAVVAARTLFPPEATATLRDDAVAAFFWVANWAFVAQKTDYFSQGSPPSPLQHTWSLGVEEQYYLFWPLLVIAVAAVIGARARWAVFALAAAGVVALGRRGHLDGVRRNGEPGLLRHRHPGAGPAGGRRRGRPAGARLVGADGRWHVDSHAVEAVGRGRVVGPRPGDVGGTGALRDGQRA